MKLARLALSSFCAVTMTASPLFAHAQEQPRWYIGGSVGQSEFKDTCDGVPVPCDKKDTAWRVFGGYKINRTFGVELGYIDFGEASASGTISGVSVRATGEATAWDLAGTASFPVADRLSVFGKLGLYRAKTEVRGTAAIAGFSATASDSESNTGLTFGVGGIYDFTRNIGVRVEWQRYNNIGGNRVGGKDDIDVLSIGVVGRF
jgi:OmpA-OmpF porin, OOP family